jgi:hypothetical protein
MTLLGAHWDSASGLWWDDASATIDYDSQRVNIEDVGFQIDAAGHFGVTLSVFHERVRIVERQLARSPGTTPEHYASIIAELMS